MLEIVYSSPQLSPGDRREKIYAAVEPSPTSNNTARNDTSDLLQADWQSERDISEVGLRANYAENLVILRTNYTPPFSKPAYDPAHNHPPHQHTEIGVFCLPHVLAPYSQ